MDDAMTSPPDVQNVLALVTYNPLSGAFTRAKNAGGKLAGSKAGWTASNGYREIRVNKQRFLAHRLAWFIYYGRFPIDEIDHINGDKSDNRICNLREATSQQNKANTRVRGIHGVKGVKKAPSGRWRARICIGYERIYLGTFDTKEQAHQAYMVMLRKHFGEFARHG